MLRALVFTAMLVALAMVAGLTRDVERAGADCIGEASPDCLVAANENSMTLAALEDVNLGLVGDTITFTVSIGPAGGADVPYSAFYFEAASNDSIVDFVGFTYPWQSIRPSIQCYEPVSGTNGAMEVYGFGAFCLDFPDFQTTTFAGVAATFTVQCIAPTGPEGAVMYLLDVVADPFFGSTTLSGDVVPTETLPQVPYAYGPPAFQAGVTYHCVAGGPGDDSDGDNCSNGQEDGPNHVAGGQRNKASRWDFYDVPAPALKTNPAGARDRFVTLTDALAILAYVGDVSGSSHYDADVNANGMRDGEEYDRRPPADPSKPWLTRSPSGAVTLTDVVVVLGSIGDICM